MKTKAEIFFNDISISLGKDDNYPELEIVTIKYHKEGLECNVAFANTATNTAECFLMSLINSLEAVKNKLLENERNKLKIAAGDYVDANAAVFDCKKET